MLSVGALPNQQPVTRVGLRTRKGLKGAVQRNRLKRQLRAIMASNRFSWRGGLDIVVVLHPNPISQPAPKLEGELLRLCKRLRAIS